jgi:hypothetical protein
MLPNEYRVVALILDNADTGGADQIGLGESLLHINLGVTKVTEVEVFRFPHFYGTCTCGAIDRNQLVRGFGAHLGGIKHVFNLMITGRTFCASALGLIIEESVFTVGTDSGGEFLSLHINIFATYTAMNDLFGKQGCGRLMHRSAFGTFNNKFSHFLLSFIRW